MIADRWFIRWVPVILVGSLLIGSGWIGYCSLRSFAESNITKK